MEALEDIMAAAGIPAFGVCRFAALAPLLPCRAAQRLPQGAQSVIVCLFPYYVGEYGGRNLARYAMVADYHTVARTILEAAAAALGRAYPGEQFVAFTDNSPVREVWAAYLAGLGSVGKNGLLVTREYGSYCCIGELVTTLHLPAATPLEGGCGTCMRCISACPNGAIGAEGKIDRERCRSHITQKKGELTAFERETICKGGFVWGCDCCTDSCPHNRIPRLTPIDGFYCDIVHTLTEENCGPLCKTRAFGYRGAAVLRRNLELVGGAEREAPP